MFVCIQPQRDTGREKLKQSSHAASSKLDVWKWQQMEELMVQHLRLCGCIKVLSFCNFLCKMSCCRNVHFRQFILSYSPPGNEAPLHSRFKTFKPALFWSLCGFFSGVVLPINDRFTCHASSFFTFFPFSFEMCAPLFKKSKLSHVFCLLVTWTQSWE